MSKRFTITAALPYANGPIHIGHLAGVYISADIFARYNRMKGNDVLFVCGSDEHGVPITIRAKKEGVSPQDIVDKYHAIIKKSFEDFGISFDTYSRTSSLTHAKTASDFFTNLYKKGEFIEQTTEQYYDPKNKQFLADRYIKGTCPKCGNEEAYGDQCEKCGSTLSPDELINPKSALSSVVPIKKETKHWYLPLDKHEDFLKQWILEDHKKDWKSNVYGQCKSWLDQGLKPRAVTRDLNWGVPVPIEGEDGKVLYVWFDAPIGYISATKEWAETNNKNWETYWKDKNTSLVHFIGKDNIVFHCIIFPAMLQSHGGYILPENVPANEFLNLEGNKLSTSRNWAVWLHEYLEDFPNQQDALRYALCATAPETKDNDFTWKDFQSRNNNELADIFGNFINRVVVLTNKYYDGIIPSPQVFSNKEQEVLDQISVLTNKIESSIQRYRFREALSFLMELARLGNKYLADTEPWKAQKTNPEAVQTIMYIGLQIAAKLSVVAEPFIPFTAKRLRNILNVSSLEWSDTAETLPSGGQVNKSEILFTKIEDDEIEKQLVRLEQIKKSQKKDTYEAVKNQISFEDFTKLDLRVGTITAAQKVPKTKKLLQLTVDLGFEERTIVSGIAGSYNAKDVIGKQVTVLANLGSRKIKGIESQGMIIMAENGNEELMFVNPDEGFSNGSIIA